MSDEPNTETAFPAMTPGGYCTPGMTLRDWFAGQAMTGWLAGAGNIPIEKRTIEIAAMDCYQIADVMLEAREPKDTTTSQQIALGIGGGK